MHRRYHDNLDGQKERTKTNTALGVIPPFYYKIYLKKNSLEEVKLCWWRHDDYVTVFVAMQTLLIAQERERVYLVSYHRWRWWWKNENKILNIGIYIYIQRERIREERELLNVLVWVCKRHYYVSSTMWRHSDHPIKRQTERHLVIKNRHTREIRETPLLETSRLVMQEKKSLNRKEREERAKTRHKTVGEWGKRDVVAARESFTKKYVQDFI